MKILLWDSVSFPAAVSVAGKSVLETDPMGQVDPGRVGIPYRVLECHLWAFCVSGPVGWARTFGTRQGSAASLGVSGTTWL